MVESFERRTHRDATIVRVFNNPADYWDEADRRRRYSIPHSDGLFFADGSGYSNGPQSDLQYEIIERLREVAIRLEQLDLQDITIVQETRVNSDSIPYAGEIEEDIRLARRALALFEQENLSDDVLRDWQQTFANVATKWIDRAASMCGTFIENTAVTAGKEFGPAIIQAGGLAAALFFAGTDFQGIAAAIGALIMLRAAKS